MPVRRPTPQVQCVASNLPGFERILAKGHFQHFLQIRKKCVLEKGALSGQIPLLWLVGPELDPMVCQVEDRLGFGSSSPLDHGPTTTPGTSPLQLHHDASHSTGQQD